MGVVALAAPAPGWGPANIVPVVNRLRAQFDQLGISERVKEAGPLMIFYAHDQGSDVVVHLALPVVEQPAGLPPPAQYLVLPEIEAATAVRSGPAASIFPFVYHDLTNWIEAQGYQSEPPGREVWINEIDDVADVDQQVFEIQQPFTRTA
jgi:effector-binding domain-containing protein